MANPITKISKPIFNEADAAEKSLEKLMTDVVNNAEGIQQTMKLLQELHESGILEALNALVEAKEKVAKIAVGQVLRPPVTNAINNAMAAAGVLTELDPAMTKKLMGSVSNGLQKAQNGLETNKKVRAFDLAKALRDPDINRAIGFGLNLLKGIGEGLK